MVITKTLKRPRIMPYGFNVEPNSILVCHDWCEKEFGSRFVKNNQWTYKSCSYISRRTGKDIGYASFYFMNEEDAVAFKVKWA